MNRDRAVAVLLMVLSGIWLAISAVSFALLATNPESYAPCGGSQSGFLGALLMFVTAVLCLEGTIRLWRRR